MKYQNSSETRQQNTDNSSSTRALFRALSTIYRLKIWQMMLILFICTIVFYGLDYLYSEGLLPGQLNWLGSLPLDTLADVSFAALVIGFTYEWFVRKEFEGKLSEIISDKLRIQREAIAEEIQRALLTDGEVMRKVLSASRVEDIILTGLQIHLGDDQLGSDVYDGLLRTMLSYKERWENYRFKVTLASIEGENVTDEIKNKYYQAYIDLRYETRLQRTRFLYTCVSTIEEYNTLLRDPKYQTRWMFEPTREFPQADSSMFDVDFVSVAGIELDIRRETTPEGRYLITAEHPDLEAKLGSTVAIYYRYQGKLQKRGHLFTVNVVYPTKGVVIELDYAETDIHFVNVLDFFVSADKPVIRYAPSIKAPHKIEVELNEWAFPKGGVTFVWVLRSEMTPQFLKLLAASRS